MPRGVKGSVNFAAEIAKVDEKIARYEHNIRQLKVTRQELENKKRDFDMKELYTVMAETGLSPNVLIDAIKNGVIAQDSEQ